MQELAIKDDKEQQRLEALGRYCILDTVAEEDFNSIVNLASEICQTPISLITLLDADRQWFKAKKGIDLSETDIKMSFCTHAIQNNKVFVINEADKDYRFADNPMVTGPSNIRFYAGVPIQSVDGHALGTLCVIDNKPRELTENQLNSLKILANQVQRLLELRLANIMLEEKSLEVAKQQAELTDLDTFKNDLLRVVSHDLRSPLNGIETMLYMLDNEMLGKEELEKVKTEILSRVKRAKILINDLFTWVEGVNLQKQLNAELIFPHEKIEEEIMIMDEFIKYKENLVLNKVDPSIQMNIDPNIFKFIIRNLLSNANKFTQKGIIEIGCKLTGDQFNFYISDTGVGMEPIISENLFNIKTIKSSSGTKNERGLGVGLNLVKRFVDMKKGHVYCKSVQGVGTTIHLQLKSCPFA